MKLISLLLIISLNLLLSSCDYLAPVVLEAYHINNIDHPVQGHYVSLEIIVRSNHFNSGKQRVILETNKNNCSVILKKVENQSDGVSIYLYELIPKKTGEQSLTIHYGTSVLKKQIISFTLPSTA
ncbi:MAG: hypothetical protein KZQ83_14170 [gamma proteobacterium symbiont of Taylorina sp.]|nr:hypothetical protein [gamma proteobacterium symbiont of Taylorina sp.]